MLAFDLIPAAATAPATITTLLRGGGVEGVARARRLTGRAATLARSRSPLLLRVGESRLPDAARWADLARSRAPPSLKLLDSNCANYAARLLADGAQVTVAPWLVALWARAPGAS